VSNGFSDTDVTNCGAKLLPSVSPLASVRRTIEKIPPSAFSTPGTRSTRGSSAAVNAGGSLAS
jgi:hypothetical protein